MSSFFRILRLLESHNVPFFIQRTRPDAVSITATFLGKRLEIYAFEDDHIEVSEFIGSEEISGGEEIVEEAIKDDA